MKRFTKNDLLTAASFLREGKIIAFPTETVFGLGAIYDNHDAYLKLIELKKRPPKKAFTLMFSNINQINDFANLTENDKKVIQTLMPGEITLIVRAKEGLPFWAHLGTNLIGVRVPNDETTLKLIEYVGKPLLVPSANRDGQKPLILDKEVIKEFFNELDGVVLGKAKSALPSTVVKVYDKVEIIREGNISLEEILKIIGEN